MKESLKYANTAGWPDAEYLVTIREYSQPGEYFFNKDWMVYQNHWAKTFFGKGVYKYMNHFRIAAKGGDKPPVVQKDAPLAELPGFGKVGSSYKANKASGKAWTAWIQDQFLYMGEDNFKSENIDDFIRNNILLLNLFKLNIYEI